MGGTSTGTRPGHVRSSGAAGRAPSCSQSTVRAIHWNPEASTSRTTSGEG
ncbi:hypothetical protein AB0D46_31870 [Streptomyces sp. NPDC048383]